MMMRKPSNEKTHRSSAIMQNQKKKANVFS